MKFRDRAYVPINFDYNGVIAQGDVWYGEEWDDWNDMKKVFEQQGLDVPIVEKHSDTEFVGKIQSFMIDNGRKQIRVGFNEENMVSGYEIQEFSGVSPRWITEGNKIVGIEHIAISNDFEPLCAKDLCSIKDRSKKMDKFDYKKAYEELSKKFSSKKDHDELKDKFDNLVELLTEIAEEEPEKPNAEPEEPEQKEGEKPDPKEGEKPDPKEGEDPEVEPKHKKIELTPKEGEGEIKPQMRESVKGGFLGNTTLNTEMINNMRK